MRERSRTDLLDIYRHAIAAVEGRRCVRAALDTQPRDDAVHLIAIGKAAGSMACGAWESLGDSIASALIITRRGYPHGPDELAAVTIEAGHPLPDESSLEAGRVLLDTIGRAPSGGSFLFLLSGGTSALVEVPRTGIELDALRRAYQWLMGSGLSIAEINRVRKDLSCIKGGRLAERLRGHRVCQLLISDVPGDDPAVIGSGLLTAGYEVLSSVSERRLPDWLREMRTGAPAAPLRRAQASVATRIIATSLDARRAAAERARALGYRVTMHEAPVTGDAVGAGRRLAEELLQAEAGLHIWGGETVVELPDYPGRGGRCQSLALSAAQRIAGRAGCFMLAAGTDGGDGPGPAAGAIVDGATVERGGSKGLDPALCLRRADAGSFLEASGDLIRTGPTSSNVMDLMLGCRRSPASPGGT